MKAFIRQSIFITIILFLGTAAFAKSTSPAPIPPQTYAPLNLYNTSELSQKIEQYIKAAALMFPDKKIEGAIIFIVPQIICNLGEI